MLDMNPEIRAQWTAALRSGDYPQGTGYLNRDGEFCCLGVLCDLAEQAGVVTSDLRMLDAPSDLTPPEAVHYVGHAQALPAEVMAWAGLDQDMPEVLVPADMAPEVWFDEPEELVDEEYCLAEINDTWGWDFNKIADLIDGGVSESEAA